MKLLAATTRYYLLLATALFVVGSVGLYYGVQVALREEVDEQLRARRQELLEKAQARQLPPVALLETLLVVSRRPAPGGFRDTALLDVQEREMVPNRQLTFPLQTAAEGTVWVTLRKSLVETEDLLGVVLPVMLAVLLLLLAGVVLINRRLSVRLWGPFRHTLASLRHYDLRQHQVLALPTPAITEFAELNHALMALSQRLVAEYETLREFTANAAHETQTPLAIMQAQLEQLLQVPALAHDPAAAPLLADLYGATLRLSRLHQALSLLSKIENRQFAQAVPVRLDALLREKVAHFEPLFAARELRYGVDVAGVPVVHMHPGLADSLLQNLLQNALKHNIRGGEVAILLSEKLLRISNSGPLVSGDPARFFERFRKHNAASESPGLGLSIVQQICSYYGFKARYSYDAATSYHTLLVAFSAAPVASAGKKPLPAPATE